MHTNDFGSKGRKYPLPKRHAQAEEGDGSAFWKSPGN